VPHATRRYLIPIVLLATAALLSGSVRRSRSHTPQASFGLAKMPLELSGFRGRVLPSDESVFAYLGADEMIDRLYVDPEEKHTVKLSVVFARGWRALHSPRSCYKNQGWAVVEDTPDEMAPAEGKTDPIHATRLVMSKPDGSRFVAVYTFATGPATTGSWFLHSARMAFGGAKRGGALIAVVAPSSTAESDPAATAAAEGLVRQALGFMQGRWEGKEKSSLDSKS